MIVIVRASPARASRIPPYGVLRPLALHKQRPQYARSTERPNRVDRVSTPNCTAGGSEWM